MSTYYDIRTKATIQDVSCSSDLQIEKSDNDGHCYVRDKFNNVLSCLTDNEGRIVNIKRYGLNDPTFVLYKLVVDFDSLILVESMVHELMHEAIKMPNDIYFMNYGNSWEEFSCSLLTHLQEENDPEHYDLGKVNERLCEIRSKIKENRPIGLLSSDEIENYGQDYYVFCNNTTVYDVARNPGILIEKDNMEDNIYWIKDRYEGVIECHTQNSGVIEYIIPHEQSAWYVLYTMAIEHSALFMDKDVHEKVVQFAKDKGMNEQGGYVYNVKAVFVRYVDSFTNLIKDKGLEQEFTSM